MSNKTLTGIFLLGTILMTAGLYLAVYETSAYWYSSFAIGGTLALASVNSLLGRETLLADIRARRLSVLYYYLSLVAWAIFIEGVGNYLFSFWNYPDFNFGEHIVYVLLIGYPLGFMFGFETFVLIKKFFPSFVGALILTTIASGFAHELPNLYAHEWVYTIPFFTYTIFGINLFVLTGYVLLILVPLHVREFLKLSTFQHS